MNRAVTGRERACRAEAEFSVPLERVWAVVADVEGASGWHAGLRRVRLGDGGVSAGTGARVSGGWPGNAWLHRVEAPFRLEVLFFPDLLGVREVIAVTLESLGESRTRVTVEHRASGAVAAAWLWWRARQARGAVAALERAAGGGR